MKRGQPNARGNAQVGDPGYEEWQIEMQTSSRELKLTTGRAGAFVRCLHCSLRFENQVAESSGSPLPLRRRLTMWGQARYLWDSYEARWAR
jgi:hypothetical protein